jgi:type I restriction enzyme, S subunit
MGKEVWMPRKLNELGSIGRGKSRHRPRNAPELYGGPYPFVQTGDIKEAELYLNSYTQTYSEIGLSQSRLWKPGTLCITIAANIAETAILGLEACFPDSVVGFVANPTESDVRFVKYYIDTIKLQMQSISRGTTQDNLSLEKLLTFDILTPPLPTQRKIADILSAYDDLIENNTRRIRILEQMAQALYREWFVHFRFPGHEGVKVVDGVPEGWERVKLGDVVELAYVDGLKADKRKPGNVPVFGSGGIVGYHDESSVKGPGIIVGRKGNVGSVFWSDDDFFPIDTVFYVKTAVCLHYVFYNLQSQNFINNDAAVPGLNRHQAYLLPFLLPKNDVLEHFQKFVEPIFRQTQNLRMRNANLRRTRDLLLPRLVGGDVVL